MNLVILASARGESNTLKAIQKLCPVSDYELIDLRSKRIELYDYEHSNNAGDDFLGIVQKMAQSDVIVFATPVYWYSMSGLMKVFLDRFTELLSTHRLIGKALKGKAAYLISTGSDSELPPGFESPFKLTSDYFEMKYIGAFYLPLK